MNIRPWKFQQARVGKIRRRWRMIKIYLSLALSSGMSIVMLPGAIKRAGHSQRNAAREAVCERRKKSLET